MIEWPRQPLGSGQVLGLADLRHVITGAGQAIWSHCRSFLCRRPAIDRVLHLSPSAGTAGNGRSTSGLSAIRAVTAVAKLIWCKRDRVSDLTANATTPRHPNNLRFPRAFFGLLLSPPGGPILQQASHEALPLRNSASAPVGHHSLRRQIWTKIHAPSLKPLPSGGW